MDKFPVDENNLSFSDDDGDSLFITQSTFRNIDTQVVADAVDYFDTLGNAAVGDSPNVQNVDVNGIVNVEEFDWCDHKDVQYFNFDGQIDNGYEVNTQDDGYLVKSHADGNEIFIADSANSSDGYSTKPPELSSEILHGQPSTYDVSTVGCDLKRFGEAVSEEKLDENKFKRYAKIFRIFLLNFQTCQNS